MSSCNAPTNDTSIRYRGDGSGLAHIYENLVTPGANITSLELLMTMEGCVVTFEPWSFQFRDGDKFPALRELRLSDYDLTGEEEWRWANDVRRESWRYQAQSVIGKVVPAWAPQDLPKSESNLEQWLRAMDFSKLEHLDLEQHQSIFFERMKHELPGLRHLSTVWANSGSSVPKDRMEFLRNIPPLESLALRIGAPYWCSDGLTDRTEFPLSTILERHGPTLRSLSLQQTESADPDRRRPMLSLADIDHIRTSCANLNHLGLDLDRDAETGWPNATIDSILRIPSLISLTIGLELGVDLHDVNERSIYDGYLDDPNDGDRYREPRMSLNVSEALFQHWRMEKVGKDLQRVEFVVGNWIDSGYMGPIAWFPWEYGRAEKFVCEVTPDEKDTVCNKYGDYFF